MTTKCWNSKARLRTSWISDAITFLHSSSTLAPNAGDELDPRQARDPDQPESWAFICWECETSFTPQLTLNVESILDGEKRISVDPDKAPRNPVPPKPASMDFSTVNDLIRRDLEETGATADQMTRAVEESVVAGGLMDINDWIDQTLAAKRLHPSAGRP